MNNYKSATTAGLLGIFLGTVGAHNWYLGEKSKGILHVVLAASGLVLTVLAGAILPEVLPWRFVYRAGWLFVLLNSIGWLAMAASELWGFIEGIQILTKGDAGLAMRGYPVVPQMNNFNNYNGMNSNMNPNMNNMNGMNGGMNNMNMNGNGMNMNGMSNMNDDGMNVNMNNQQNKPHQNHKK